ncbi:MAG: aminotransferase class V-fold PLP-dependent enzyme, partial [Desulfovibrio sp.]|nr:aminotransferase class V-fold PLP-dependent enzyme [Desulfovibrio sp.]
MNTSEVFGYPTPNPKAYGLPDPRDYGLPGTEELAALLSAYCPDFAPQPPPQRPAPDGAGEVYAPRVVSRATPTTKPAAHVPGAGGLPSIPAVEGLSPSAARVGNVPVETLRADFPILGELVDGHRLVWFDNAATTQKPRAVIDRLTYYYSRENSNVHRGAHTLAERSTDAYEEARGKIARFIGAPSSDTIVFVRGTTEGINLTA